MDNVKLWEIWRYIDSAEVQASTQALPTTKELLALGQFTVDGLYDAILLAFAYGRAKGKGRERRGSVMNNTAASFAIMDSLMDAIECNNVWNQIQQADPMIQRAEQARYEAEKEAAAILPRDLANRLSEATTSVESALVTAAILYGMRVSAAISAATANQVDFSQYILDRTDKKVSDT